MLVDRRDDRHAVPVKGLPNQTGFSGTHSAHADVEYAVQQAVDHALTVALMDDKVCVGMLLSIDGQNLREDIGGGDGGRAQVDHVLVLVGTGGYHAVPQLQNIDGVFIDFLALWRKFYCFGGSGDQAGVQFLLQLAYMGTDGRLRQIQKLCRPCEASPLPASRELEGGGRHHAEERTAQDARIQASAGGSSGIQEEQNAMRYCICRWNNVYLLKPLAL